MSQNIIEQIQAMADNGQMILEKIKNDYATKDELNNLPSIEDSYLDDVSYTESDNILTFTFTLNNGNKETVDVDLKHLVDVYNADETTLTKSDNTFSIKPNGHNQASNTINKMTGYSKPSSTSAIAATDTLNTAIGKLERALDDIDSGGTVTTVKVGDTSYSPSLGVVSLPAYPDISGKANTDDIPTKTSELTNDSGFLTSIPNEYITETELSAKGYLTSIPAEYVTETELANKKYLTSIPSEYVTETELANKGYLTEHQDISGKADKSDLTSHTTDPDIHVSDLEKQVWNNKADRSEVPQIYSGSASATKPSNAPVGSLYIVV